MAENRNQRAIAKKPAPLEAVIRQSYAALDLRPDQITSLYQREAAVVAVNLTPHALSTPLYAFDALNGLDIPTRLEDAVTRGVGICGHQAELYGAILTRLGLETRPVQFWWRNDEGDALNHIAMEVLLAIKWRLFDPTFAAYFVDEQDELLSTEEARKGNHIPVFNQLGATYRSYTHAGLDPFAHLRRDRVGITINYRGVIDLVLETEGDALVTQFENIPNYAGDNRLDGDPSGISFRLPDLSGRFEATLEISGHGGCNQSMLHINDHPIAIGVGKRSVSVNSPSTLSVRGTDDACYVILKSAQFTPDAH